MASLPDKCKDHITDYLPLTGIALYVNYVVHCTIERK